MKKANNVEQLIKSIKGGRFTLDGSHLIVNNVILCFNNNLTSLIGVPKEVDGSFNCANNNLTSLEGAPRNVTGDFSCSYNQLTSLNGAPEKVGGNFVCSENVLISLEGAPEKVGGKFICSNNKLTSLEGVPKEVGGDFSCSNNKLTSLKEIHKHINRIDNTFRCTGNPLKGAILGLLLIDGLKDITINPKVDIIVNKYLPGGSDKTKLYKCAQELVKAGYPELAKL